MQHLFSKSFRHSLSFLVVIMITGCASTPKHQSMLRTGDQVMIDSADSSEGEYKFTYSNEAFSDDVATGATTGAVVGLSAGFLCGPLFLLCAGAGALIYGGAGAAIGAVVGVTTDLSVYKTEHLDAINNKVETFITGSNVQKDFLSSVMTAAGNRYQINKDPSTDKKVRVLFSAMGLNHQGDDSVVLITQSYVTVNYKDDSGELQEITQMYQYISPPNKIESWVNEGEEFYQQHFTRAYRIMAENIIMTLAY